MTRFSMIPAVFFAILLVQASAQTVSHKVNFPANPAAWTVTFEVMESDSPGKDQKPEPAAEPAKTDKTLIPAQMKKIVVARTATIRRDIVTWSDGKTTECWWMQKPAFVFQDEEKGGVGVMRPGNMGDRRCDESLFDWVGADTYLGMRELKKKLCRYYAKEIVLPNTEKAVLSAWIDNETSLPLGWSMGGGVTIFSFEGQAVPENMKLPERFQPKLKKLEAFFAPSKKNSKP